MNEAGVGGAVPNSTVSKGMDRGASKISNVDPEILRQYGTWQKMKAAQHKLLDSKKRRLIRNIELDPSLEDLLTVESFEALSSKKAWQQMLGCWLRSSLLASSKCLPGLDQSDIFAQNKAPPFPRAPVFSSACCLFAKGF